MNKIVIFVSVLCCSFLSCTMEKTDYKAEIDGIVPEHTEFKEVTSMDFADYHITLNALNGTLYKGYNEVRLQVRNKSKNRVEEVSKITFLPLKTAQDGTKSTCPYRFSLNFLGEERSFAGYAVFNQESSAADTWVVYLNITIGTKTFDVRMPVSVKPQPNKNLGMTEFTGSDGGEYIIALISPQKPKVAKNELVAGIYQLDKPTGKPIGVFPDPSQFSYSEVKGYTLLLDPRMPGPSMGNHSSPNNADLKQADDGLYHGVVNYTMTGNWTLNLIMLNQKGEALKGTVVPHDFTPGVEGAKSELRIDILF